MNENKLKIEVLPGYDILDERENSMFHTSYEIETAFYSAVGRGDSEEVERYLSAFTDHGIVTGKLSRDNLRQTKYWAVCCIAIATRYAIAGGLPENDAFNYSDSVIYKIDIINSEDEIKQCLLNSCRELTEKVHNARELQFPLLIRKCMKLINERLFEDMHLGRIAEEFSVSKDYLSNLFKKYTGYTLPQYIKKERLKYSKELLKSGYSISHTAYLVRFTSESYYIKCFRDEFGITPGNFLKN